MAKCSFCGKNVSDHEGLIYVKKDGKVLHFCSSKCERNNKLGRLPRNTRWVKE